MKLIKIAKLTEDAILPTRKHPNDVGLDLYSSSYYDEKIPPASYKVVHTGITMEIPDGFFGWITNKSSAHYLIGGGIVDPGYQGELLIKVINPYPQTLIISRGVAVAQIVFIRTHPEYLIREVPEDRIHLSLTERGNTGGIVGQS